MTIIQPENIDAVVDAVASHNSLEIIGLASKRGFGHTAYADQQLCTTALEGVLFYEPAEMVLSVRAGTRLSTINQLLADHRQRLAFEPPAWNRLLGSDIDDQTIGGVVSCNLSGSRRLSAGACRDHVLGFVGVNGRAEVFKSGGRVVKNVTGYDLPKLMTGAHGTLGVLCELTLRTMPLPEVEQTLVIPGLDPIAATSLFAQVLGGHWEAVSAGWLPPAHATVAGQSDACALLRFEGMPESVATRTADLRAEFGLEHVTLETDTSRALWQALSDNEPMTRRNDTAVWRLSVPPAASSQLLEQLPGIDCWLDWAGGLIWLQIDDRDDAGAGQIRAVIREHGGHATLVRASTATRAAVPVFEPRQGALAALEQRVRAAFDPERRLNPGRIG